MRHTFLDLSGGSFKGKTKFLLKYARQDFKLASGEIQINIGEASNRYAGYQDSYSVIGINSEYWPQQNEGALQPVQEIHLY